MNHCWSDQGDEYEWGSPKWAECVSGVGGTCMLPECHSGPHVYTPDDQIAVVFPEKKENTNREDQCHKS